MTKEADNNGFDAGSDDSEYDMTGKVGGGTKDFVF